MGPKTVLCMLLFLGIVPYQSLYPGFQDQLSLHSLWPHQSIEAFIIREQGERTLCAYASRNYKRKKSNLSMQRTLRTWLYQKNNHPQKPTIDRTENRSPTIRVLLAQGSMSEPCTWLLDSEYGIAIYNQSGTIKKKSKRLEIHIKHGSLYVNNKRIVDVDLYLKPLEGHTIFGDRSYGGLLLIHQAHNKVYIINSLDLEEYICGVLSTESWPGWPLEVNKVLAIASRSYVMALLQRTTLNKLPYHILNSNYHQTYGGVHDNPVHRTAVEETRGICLTYKNQPIIAMFDGCCGGVIPAHINEDLRDTPYLARPYPCTFCKNCRIYHWKAQYHVDDFLKKIKPEAPHISKVKHVTIAQKDKAGLVRQISIKGSGKQSAKVEGRKLYSLLKEVKSFCFTIHHVGDEVTVEGRGFGHHKGLCQWGAREMVRNGKDYKAILQFYYPGTTFMKLT